MSTNLKYIGNELNLFAKASQWKCYLRAEIDRFVSGSVLEVGAGLGTTTRALWKPAVKHWVCVEPDAELCLTLQQNLSQWSLHCDLKTGTIESVPAGDGFDCILYVDVLEHIEYASHELELAQARLRTGGYLVVLAPAHQWLYTPFDQAGGHYRRYSRSQLLAIAPRHLRVVKARYLDSVGLLATLGNRMFLRRSIPTVGQIRVWDSVLVPLSRTVDRLFCNSIGKSVLCVWRREQ